MNQSRNFSGRDALLRDGRRVHLRTVGENDIDGFLGFFAGLSAKSKDFMHGWGDIGTREHAAGFVGKIASEDHTGFVAVSSDERIVGYCWLDGLVSADLPMLGIGVVDAFHEVGLGRLLLTAMIEHARGMGYAKVRLGVWTDNARALRVYRKVGFVDDPMMLAKEFDGRTELYLAVETRRSV